VKIETPYNYIKAYRLILMKCANQFVSRSRTFKDYAQYAPKEIAALKSKFLENVDQNFKAYLRSWGVKNFGSDFDRNFNFGQNKS